jgi:uncharacterized protein YhfF
MRRRLTALVLAGQKTATAGLLVHDYERESEALEHVGEELVVVDADERPAAVIVVDSIETVPLARVGWEFADAEGEGFESIDEWRRGHEAYWKHEGVSVSDQTVIVCLRFHVVPDREL